MDQKPPPSLFPLVPLHLIFSEMPELITAIKTKEENQKGGADKKVKKYLLPGKGIRISLLLKSLSKWVQRAGLRIGVAQGAICPGQTEGVIVGGLNRGR
jgi:hypothetical protein